VRLQRLDDYRYLAEFAGGDYKCVAAATVAGGTLLSCARCGGTDDF